MSREQQDVQSFADGNLQNKLDPSNWCVKWCTIKIINRAMNAIKKINRSTALRGTIVTALRSEVVNNKQKNYFEKNGVISSNQSTCLQHWHWQQLLTNLQQSNGCKIHLYSNDFLPLQSAHLCQSPCCTRVASSLWSTIQLHWRQCNTTMNHTPIASSDKFPEDKRKDYQN